MYTSSPSKSIRKSLDDNASLAATKKKLFIGIPKRATGLQEEASRLFGSCLKTVIANQNLKFVFEGEKDYAKADGILTDTKPDSKNFDWNGVASKIIQYAPQIIDMIPVVYNGLTKNLDAQQSQTLGVLSEDVEIRRQALDLQRRVGTSMGRPIMLPLSSANSGTGDIDHLLVSKSFAAKNLINIPYIPVAGFLDHLCDLIRSINSQAKVNVQKSLTQSRPLKIGIPLHDPLWLDAHNFDYLAIGSKALEARYRTMLRDQTVDYVYTNEPHDVLMTSDSSQRATTGRPCYIAKNGTVEGTLGVLDSLASTSTGNAKGLDINNSDDIMSTLYGAKMLDINNSDDIVTTLDL